MRKFSIFFIILFCFYIATGCGVRQNAAEDKSNGEIVPTPSASAAPQTDNITSDYSMTTTLPDGTQRVEGKYLSDKDENTIVVETVGGNKEIKISSKIKEHIKLLKIEHGNIILLTVKNGVADSIEKVVS